MIDWRPVSAMPPEYTIALVFIPGGGEDFDGYHIAFVKAGSWRLQEDDKLHVDPSHWAALEPPTP